jgi:hypothetical protein
MANKLVIFSILFIIQHGFGQSRQKPSTSFSNYPEKGQHWLDLNLGLSFFISNESALNEFALLTNEQPDYFGFLLQPKYQYFIEEKLSIGFHLGFGHENLYENSMDFDQSNQVFFTGFQTEYFFLELKNIFYLSTELDAGINYFNRNNETSNTYFKSGLSLITSFLVKEKLVVFMKLCDIFSYASSDHNFFNFDKSFSVNNTFRNFINFPQFGIRYKLF